jgi:hypothetical protein
MADERDKLGMKIASRMFSTTDLVEYGDVEKHAAAKKILALWGELTADKATIGVWFLVTNSRVDFTYTLSLVEQPDPSALAEALVRAVEEFEVKHEAFTPTEIARSDGRSIKYTKHAKLSWKDGTITTNFVPEEGNLFLSCMGSVVFELRKQAAAKTPIVAKSEDAN